MVKTMNKCRENLYASTEFFIYFPCYKVFQPQSLERFTFVIAVFAWGDVIFNVTVL